ncbi:MAG: redoxin domain-containing protein [Peptoniphilus sp.]|nr:redoxin domain-containing protein [Peptoniphilus sp.]MDD7363206.1 redoxin domain-containing protein [Bacillota bacterium]MDY6044470.1 redoxin domain-containing protein [Peptoniphilus sp.]
MNGNREGEMIPLTILQKGDKAPEFELRTQTGEKINSKDIEGKILLAFHPLAFTAVCGDQMRDLERNYERLKEKGITPFGVSVDAHPSKGVWAKALDISDLTLLSDFNPKGELAKACGVYVEEAGISGRAVLIFEDGEVKWSKQYPDEQLPDIEEIIEHC